MTTNHPLERTLDELEALAMTSSAARAEEATKIFEWRQTKPPQDLVQQHVQDQTPPGCCLAAW